ncbi:MAG: UDP-N-acetylglucosamine--N-acetylmuramyl-(pentapeptide) pyrophosphoryl-undecaprenol N-acetylglucosamine transferase [Anaerolineae bacterium]|nr:UDP-N-acetylglucosamine--N-acetylmuramyl-(pentapeptide) pyrophosphoryl-undecaprenol N-acetylglucosamine transferase [Anaerolineae bacterium]
MRLIVSAGGTGGGIYPALAVAARIRKQYPTFVLHFVGSAAGLENDLIEAEGCQFATYHTVQAGPLHGVSLPRVLLSLMLLVIGTLQAVALFLRFRPNGVFLTGGWVGLPVALAGTVFRVPIVIFVPDIEPGLTLKVLGRFASVITATTEATQAFFPGKKVIATGYPLRESVLEATREAGQQHFHLETAIPTLLVFGGSRGARSINRALMANIENLLQDLQVIHVTGSLDWPEMQGLYQKLSPELRQHYQLFEYLHEMGLAMAAADLVVSRAGASTLGEFPYFGLPSVLVPYPHAWRYQKVNADWLVERGAAVRLDDEKLNDELVPVVRGLITNPVKLQAMREAVRRLGTAQGAENIAQLIAKGKT